METMPQIKLPFWECLRRSFFYTFVNFDAFVKIASVWFLILLYEIFTGFPSLCGLKDGGCPGATFQNISVVMVSLASVAVAVAFSRLVILREHVRPFAFSFGRRELKYLAYSLLLFLLIIVPAVMVMGIVAGVLERRPHQYLYMEGADYIFMNQETFDQIPIAHDLINGVDFLLEGMVVDVVSDASTETVLFADVPVKVQMKITYTEPGLKGDTATNTLKPATVESGAIVRVPLFINEGETIEIDTRDGSYVGRVKA